MTDAISGLRNISQNYMDEYNRSGASALNDQMIAAGAVRSGSEALAIGNAAEAQNKHVYDAAAGQISRAQEGLGVQMTGREQASQSRRLGLARVLGNVDARNRAMSADMSRRNAIRTGAFGLRDMVDQTAVSAYSTAANLQNQRETDQIQQTAENKAARYKTIGTMAGIALSFIPGGAFIAPMVSQAIANKGMQ